MKKYLIIILVIVIAVIAWVLIFFKKSPSAPANNPAAGGSLPTVGTQSNASGTQTQGSSSIPVFNPSATASSSPFSVVSNEPIVNYFVGAQGNVTAVEPNGKIAEISNGEVSYISPTEIQNIIGATFSADGKKIIVSFGDADAPQASIFNVDLKTWISLPAGTLSPVWAPDGYQFAYIQEGKNGEESILRATAATSTTSKPATLATVHMQDTVLSWINKNELSLTDKPSDYAEGSALIYNIQQKSFTPQILEAFGLETLWSNTTDTLGLLFSVHSGGAAGTLQLRDAATGNTRNIGFFTLPTKCAFDASASSTLLYCAIPQDANQLSSASLPEDYNQSAIFTSDSFYKMDTTSGALTQVFTPAIGAYDGTDLKISNNTLFFVNRYDQKLYAISL